MMRLGRQPGSREQDLRERRDSEPFNAVPRVPGLRWYLILVWLLRLLAVLWLMKGLAGWMVILGVSQIPGIPFDQRSGIFQSTTIFFAIIDLIAGVGLWLTATWGGVVWLIAVGSQLMLGYFFPRIVPFDPVTAGIYATMAVAYFGLTWAAAREAA